MTKIWNLEFGQYVITTKKSYFYLFSIEAAELVVKRWVVEPTLNQAIEDRMSKEDLQLIYNRMYFKEYQIPIGMFYKKHIQLRSYSTCHHVLFTGWVGRPGVRQAGGAAGLVWHSEAGPQRAAWPNSSFLQR